MFVWFLPSLKGMIKMLTHFKNYVNNFYANF
jgi:hypothetical protein